MTTLVPTPAPRCAGFPTPRAWPVLTGGPAVQLRPDTCLGVASDRTGEALSPQDCPPEEPPPVQAAPRASH